MDRNLFQGTITPVAVPAAFISNILHCRICVECGETSTKSPGKAVFAIILTAKLFVPHRRLPCLLERTELIHVKHQGKVSHSSKRRERNFSSFHFPGQKTWRKRRKYFSFFRQVQVP